MELYKEEIEKMPLSLDQRQRLTAETAVFTGWLTDISIDRMLWLAMDMRVSTQLFAATDPEADSSPIFDLQGATVGTFTFHGNSCIVLQRGSRQLCFSSSIQTQLSRWLQAFQICATSIILTSPPVSLSRSLLRSSTSEAQCTSSPVIEKAAVFYCDIPPRLSSMRHLRAYATPSTILLLGELPCHGGGQNVLYRAIRFDRSVPCPQSLSEITREDAAEISATEAVALVRGLYRAAALTAPGDDGGAGTSLLPRHQGLSNEAGENSLHPRDQSSDGGNSFDSVFVADIVAVLGFIQLSRGFYLLAVLRKQLVGMIGGHCIYGIAASELLPISMEPALGVRSMWQRFQGLLTGSDPASVAEGRYHSLLLNMDLTKDFYFSYTCVQTTSVVSSL